MSEEIPEQTASDYTKISRAVDGDTLWCSRLSVALEIAGKETGRPNFLTITKAVVGQISCTVDGTIDTTGVTDEAIDLAIAALGGVS